MNGAMWFKNIKWLFLTVVLGVAAILFSLELLGATASVLAYEPQEQEPAGPLYLDPRMQAPPPQIIHVVVFTDPAVLVVQDLGGTPIGEGVHLGEVRCRANKCNRKTRLGLIVGSERIEYEYQFKTLEALDLERSRSVVAGVGTIFGASQKKRFLFTATFEDNGDGTVSVLYNASIQEASFMIPGSPGTFEIVSRP